MSLQTELEFSLPKGYVDSKGTLHRHGTMRLATAMDEIAPLGDRRVQANEAYLVVILLSRVITRLGDYTDISPQIIEDLFTADLEYLQAFYQEINDLNGAGLAGTCPACEATFAVDLSQLGGA